MLNKNEKNRFKELKKTFKSRFKKKKKFKKNRKYFVNIHRNHYPIGGVQANSV